MKDKIIKIVILALSICFIGYGVMNDEYLVVLRKAINICLECIGIG